MSYWVYLQDSEGESVEIESHQEGGTYQLGGCSEAELNVTYNYGGHIREAMHPDGLRWLDGKRASETAEALARAVAQLGLKTSGDYWEATEGNAGHALGILHGWAQQHPDAVWRVS